MSESELVVPSGARKQLIVIHTGSEPKTQTIRLAGEGASIEVDEIFLAKDVQSKLIIIHDSPRTFSRVKSRGIVGKSSQVVAHARVVIPRSSILCESAVSQRFLLLDETSRIEAIPSLEIEADDVKAVHSTAISPLDESKLFYLQARGLSLVHSRQLMIEGFLQMPPESVHLFEEWQAIWRG